MVKTLSRRGLIGGVAAIALLPREAKAQGPIGPCPKGGNHVWVEADFSPRRRGRKYPALYRCAKCGAYTW